MKNMTLLIKSKLVPMVFISSVIALTGCGGGSSSSPAPLPKPGPAVDTVAPVITLTGEANITIFQNSDYADQGASATDAVDGTVDVVTTGAINEAETGDYVFTYTATDAAGNDSEVTRTVTVTPVVLSGTAAGGAAMVGQVIVKGSLGEVISTTIDANGHYEIDVTGLTAPYRLRAEGTVGGKPFKLHSYTAEANVGGTVNITPLTDLIVANAASQLPQDFFDSTVDTSLSAEALTLQESALKAKLQQVFDALNLDDINLFNSSFSADHTGLDAALDLIKIEIDPNNSAEITNLLNGTIITDDITVSDDNDSTLEFDADSVADAAIELLAISTLFENLTSAFVEMPESEDIQDYFAADFSNDDIPLEYFYEEILNESSIGISFFNIAISDLVSDAGTAKVNFSISLSGSALSSNEQWFVTKDDTLGWQLSGDQAIVDLFDFEYECQTSGFDQINAVCGFQLGFEDFDPSNNGTDGEPILSASVSIISGQDGSVKDTFYIGTPENEDEAFAYNVVNQEYSGFFAFGQGAGEIDPNIFSVGDTIEYKLYQANLDLSDTASPSVVGSALATYLVPVNYEATVEGKYPSVSEESLDSANAFTLGDDLTIDLTKADGTEIAGIGVIVRGVENYNEYIEVSSESVIAATSVTFSNEMFDEALLDNESFDATAETYIILSIFAIDSVTGQYYITYYNLYPTD
jgi:hypothetical protein